MQTQTIPLPRMYPSRLDRVAATLIIFTMVCFVFAGLIVSMLPILILGCMLPFFGVVMVVVNRKDGYVYETRRIVYEKIEGRNVTSEQLEWLREEGYDCFVREIIEPEWPECRDRYVVFNDPTEEMLFTLRFGQTKYVYYRDVGR